MVETGHGLRYSHILDNVNSIQTAKLPHCGEAFFISIQLFDYMINFLRNVVYEDVLISEEPCYQSRTCNSDQLPGKRIDNSILIYVFIESLRFQPHILPVSYVKAYID